VLLNTLPWITETAAADVFAVSQLPLASLPDAFVESVAASGRLWVIEEHVARGGLGEHLAAHLAKLGVAFRLHHSCAAGYPDGLYGRQGYHQRQSRLDPASLQATFQSLAG
jgi:transketolase